MGYKEILLESISESRDSVLRVRETLGCAMNDMAMVPGTGLSVCKLEEAMTMSEQLATLLENLISKEGKS